MESGAFSRELCDHLFDERLQLGVGQYLVHQSHRQRLLGGVAPAEEHDLPRARVAHGLEQPLVPLDVVGEAELRRRDGELRALPAVAQVAGERNLEPAAHAEAVDHRDRGLARVLDGVQHLVEQAVVLRYRGSSARGSCRTRRYRRRRRRPRCRRRETRRSAPPDRHRTALHRRRDAAPHGVVDRVALRRLVEHDPAHAAALLHAQRHGLPAAP